MPSVTISDIARTIGCSACTVSRALNDRPGVNPKTKQKILSVAQSLGYQPNVIAQSLVSKRSYTIALIIPDIEEPVLREIALAADQFLFSKGYVLLLCNTKYDLAVEQKKLQMVTQRKVDGILIRPTDDDQVSLPPPGIPAVLFSSSYDGTVSFIDINNEAAGYMAAKYLLDCGYRRLGFIGRAGMSHVRMRFAGFSRALHERGLPVDEHLVWYDNYTFESGYRGLSRFWEQKRRPDAILCCSDRIAFGVIRRANELELSIPNDFGVIGFNDDTMSDWPEFSLTSVRQPTGYMGEMAARMLLEQIESEAPPAVHKIQLLPELIARGTTRPPNVSLIR